ncbi:MAG: hypothetical protein ACLVKL_09580 [Gemmiger formicilis]|uniref:hypothetical protein n=1 Tax=Gemmiger formicilis TaxID=745368 RepID=UPI003A3E3BFD
MNKLNKYLAWLFALDFIIIVLSLGKIVYAEEYEDVLVEAPPAAVEPTPAEETPPPAAEDVARVPVEIDADALAEALTQALATPTPNPDATPEPEQPTPTPQIIVMQSTPETAPTPEPTTAPTIWDKPFNDYSPTEGLLLVIFVALCFTALLIWLR